MKIDSNEFMQNLEKYGGLIDVVAAEAVGATMAEAERDAKSSAPWTDRTGHARQSIAGQAPYKKEDIVKGYLSIGVYYGKFLELANMGRYRVVWPTIERAATKVPNFISQAYARNVSSNL